MPVFVLKLVLRFAGGSYSGLRLDEPLKGGEGGAPPEEFDFGLKVVALHAPGHTPDHMVYYIPEEKALAGGDLIDLETGDGADLNNPHSNYAHGLASVEKVRALDIEAYLPSHGDPVLGAENVSAMLDRIIENTHAYITDVKAALADREGTLTEIFNKLMPNTPFTLKAMKMMQILTVLKHLQERGEVALDSKGKKPIWRLNA